MDLYHNIKIKPHILRKYLLQIVAHELGHSLGMLHDFVDQRSEATFPRPEAALPRSDSRGKYGIYVMTRPLFLKIWTNQSCLLILLFPIFPYKNCLLLDFKKGNWNK